MKTSQGNRQERLMDYNHLSPYIRTALDSVIDSPWKLETRVIFDYELLYIKEGNVLITIEDVVHLAQPGDVFLFKPKQPHSIEPVNQMRFRQPHLHFDLFYREDSSQVKISFKNLDKMTRQEMEYFREDITADGEMALPNKLPVRNIELFEKMLFDIIYEYEGKKQYYEITVKGLFLKLWAFLLSEYSYSLNRHVYHYIDELEQIREYIKMNVDGEITLDFLAKKFKISKYHLLRNFKKAFGMTPIHFSRQLKVERAKELIIYSHMNLTEIAEKVGFNSINAFSRAFKKIEGVAPSYYRQ